MLSEVDKGSENLCQNYKNINNMTTEFTKTIFWKISVSQFAVTI